MYVAAFPDVVVTHTSKDGGKALTATSADGSEAWSKPLTEPEGFRSADLRVVRLRDQIAVSWTDVELPLTLNEDVNPGQLTLLDPATGEQQGETIEIPDAFAFGSVSGYDTFDMTMNESGDQKFTLLADGSVELAEESEHEPLPEHEFVTEITPDRQLREVRGEDNARSVEVIDMASSQPVGPASECPSSPELGVSEPSPSTSYVGIM